MFSIVYLRSIKINKKERSTKVLYEMFKDKNRDVLNNKSTQLRITS